LCAATWTAIGSIRASAVEPSASDLPAPSRRARQIVVAWTGCVRAPAGVERTKEEARRRAREALARARSGADFAALVAGYSDEPGAPDRSGDIGEAAPGTPVRELDEALEALAPGQLAPEPVETVFGFHVLQRLADAGPYRIRQVLVTYRGALRAPPATTRSRSEALERAHGLLARLRGGAEFSALARAESDDRASASSGGVLPELRTGIAVPALEKAALAIAPGGIAGPVETPMGFHVIQRLP